MRLKQVVRAAGGNNVVAQRAGIPLGTLNSYIGGRYDLKVPALVALAAACGISVEWLATGCGEMLSARHSEILGIQLHTVSADGKYLVPTPEYEKLLSNHPESKPPVYQPEEIRQSPPVPGMAEHPESIAPPVLIDPDHLQQAIEIVKVLDGVAAFGAPNIGRRLAAAYNILSGAKP